MCKVKTFTFNVFTLDANENISYLKGFAQLEKGWILYNKIMWLLALFNKYIRRRVMIYCLT